MSVPKIILERLHQVGYSQAQLVGSYIHVANVRPLELEHAIYSQPSVVIVITRDLQHGSIIEWYPDETGKYTSSGKIVAFNHLVSRLLINPVSSNTPLSINEIEKRVIDGKQVWLIDSYEVGPGWISKQLKDNNIRDLSVSDHDTKTMIIPNQVAAKDYRRVTGGMILSGIPEPEERDALTEYMQQRGKLPSNTPTQDPSALNYFIP